MTVAGEFNNWDATRLSMHRQPGTEDWELTHTFVGVPMGRKLQFKYVVDGKQWRINPDLEKFTSPCGNTNNLLTIGQTTQLNIAQSEQKSLTVTDLQIPRMLLNEAHKVCTENNAKIFMHSQTESTIVVVRQMELDFDDQYDAYVTVSRFCFSGSTEPEKLSTVIELPGILSEVVFASNIYDTYELPSNK